MSIISPTPIPEAPLPPQRSDPSTFEERNDDAIVYLFETLPGSIDQQAEATYQNALESKTQAESATTKAGEAADSAQDAVAAAAAAAAAAGAQEWQSGQTYTAGEAAWSPLNMQTYRRTVSGGGAIDPSIDTSNWTALGTSLAQLQATALSF